MGQAILKRLLRLVRLADLLIELGNVVGDLLLGFGLCLAENTFRFFSPCSSKYQITLCQRPSVRLKTLPLVVNLFFGILLPPFFNHQHYSKGLTYVQLNVPNRAEKKLSAFWWIYILFGRGDFLRPILCLLYRNFRGGHSFWAKEKIVNLVGLLDCIFTQQFGC